MSKKIILFCLICLLAGLLGFWCFTPQQAVGIVRHYGYWIIMAAVGCFLWVLVQSFQEFDPRAILNRKWAWPALLVATTSVFLHLHEPHEFKIVADEVVLGLTAKEMHFSREASVSVRGYEYAGNFTSMVSYVDKRPLLFPFLLASFHDLTGFRVGNVYFLNGVLTLAFVGLVFGIAYRTQGVAAGSAAVLLTATVPLIAQNACGAGFEMLNLVMIALTILLGMRAAERADDDTRLGAFVLSGVLLAQVRYESVLFVLPVGAVVIYLWRRRREVALPWALFLAPLFMVLSPLQYNVFKISEATWQLNDIAGADTPFALKYFYDNIGHALNFFLCTDGSQPNSILVAGLGVLSVGFFVLLLYRRYRSIFNAEPANAVLVVFLLGLLLHTALMLCYFWGRWDDPIIRRLSLPAHLLLALATIFVWPHLVSYHRRWTVLSGMAVVYLLSFTIPSNAMHQFTQQNFAARTTNWLEGHVQALGDKSALAIDRSGGLMWLLHNKSSITAAGIAMRPEAFFLHYKNRSFAEYYLVQRATPELTTGRRLLDVEDAFDDAFELQLVEEKAFAPLYLVRLSRIVAVDEAKLMAWAKKRQAQKAQPPSSDVQTSATTSATTTASATTTTGATPQPKQEDQLLTWLRQLP